MPLRQQGLPQKLPTEDFTVKKGFTYSGHVRKDHEYSPFHKDLDYALKHFYSKSNLATIMLSKGWLSFSELHLLDHATVDVWPGVVWVKVPSYYPSAHALLFHKSEKSFCRFISKKDFLQATIDYAQMQGNQHRALRCDHSPEKMWVRSASTGEVYHLFPRAEQCECTCKAQSGLMIAFVEDTKIQALLVAHPIMRGQIPDKHVFSVWRTFGATDFEHYQYKQQEFALSRFNLWLDYVIPGHYNVYLKSQKLGTVDLKYDESGKEYWINQRQLTMLRQVPGDHLRHDSAASAAIALGKLLLVISDGEKAKSDLFGYEPDPQHLIEGHGDFLDDLEDLRLAADFEAETEEQEPLDNSRWLTAASFQ